MNDVITSVLLLAGGTFALLAAIGMVRMPDVLTRMQTATKGVTFGGGLLLLAVALHFAGLGTTARALAGVVFLLVTSPVAAHVIGRASYFDSESSPLWEGSVVDEIRPRYDRVTHVLHGLESSGAADANGGADAPGPSSPTP